MALYYNLPVYKASYKLVSDVLRSSSGFAREYKYTVGQHLKDEGVALIKNIYRANKAQDKAAALSAARENVETIRLLLRLMQEFGQIGLKKFVDINLALENVSKQLTAWEQYGTGARKKKAPPESPEEPARAQASARSESNNPLAFTGQDYRPTIGMLGSSI